MKFGPGHAALPEAPSPRGADSTGRRGSSALVS